MSTHGYLFAARLATRASSMSDVQSADAALTALSPETHSLADLIARRSAILRFPVLDFADGAPAAEPVRLAA